MTDDDFGASEEDLDEAFALPNPVDVAMVGLVRATPAATSAKSLKTSPATVDMLLTEAAAKAAEPWTDARSRGAAHATLDLITGRIMDELNIDPHVDTKIALYGSLLDVLAFRLGLAGVMVSGHGGKR